jgi:hypothetical protein
LFTRSKSCWVVGYGASQLVDVPVWWPADRIGSAAALLYSRTVLVRPTTESTRCDRAAGSRTALALAK